MNIIFSCIDKYPNININEFNDNYLNELLEKLSKENDIVFLLGDFNIYLLNYDIHPPTNTFLDSLSSHYFLPIYCSPEMNSNSETLIYNIVSNMTVPNIIYCSITDPISDHLPQFFVDSNIFLNSTYTKPSK